MVGVPTQELLDNVKQDTVQWNSKSHRVNLVDSTDGESIESKEGNVSKLNIQDNNGETLLVGILKELKKINLQLALMNDIRIEDSEVE